MATLREVIGFLLEPDCTEDAKGQVLDMEVEFITAEGDACEILSTYVLGPRICVDIGRKSDG